MAAMAAMAAMTAMAAMAAMAFDFSSWAPRGFNKQGGWGRQDSVKTSAHGV